MVKNSVDFRSIIHAFGVLSCTDPQRFGSGHINTTFLVSATNGQQFILQKINADIFHIDAICQNVRLAARHLTTYYPDYLFITPIPTLSGEEVYRCEDDSWRLTPFVKNSVSINEAGTLQQAYEAARQFGLLTRNLNKLDMSHFRPTIPNFHNLTFRFEQLQTAIAEAPEERKKAAKKLIVFFVNKREIVRTYEKLLRDPDFPDRLMHHDTKLNNVLFHNTTQRGIAVCDLDTLMPGKIISDLGDMVRTYVSPVSEESTDFKNVVVRETYFRALIEGYLSQIKDFLTETEKSAIFFSGLFLVYMQGIRFLTDYLNGNMYYLIHYPEHNLDRSQNQMILLQDLYAKQETLQKIVSEALS